MSNIWYEDRQLGANLFTLVHRSDGTFVSACTGTVEVVVETPKPLQPMHFKIPSHSDPTKDYDVTVYPDGYMTCECDGFGWRRNCSHCDDVREAIEMAKNRRSEYD